MALPSPGSAISLSQVNIELSLSATATISMNDSSLRSLFGVTGSGTQISMSQGWGKTVFLGKGYFYGGAASGAPVVNQIDGIDFITETAIDPAAACVQARDSQGAFNSPTRGYGGGGPPGPGQAGNAEIDGLDFATETAINPAAVLSYARSSAKGYNSTTRGFFVGSSNPNNRPSTQRDTRGVIDGMTFATETCAVIAATMVQARITGDTVCSSTRGYYGGGIGGPGSVLNLGPTYGSQIDGLNFATETAIDPAASLAQARRNIAGGTNSSTRGYFHGGRIYSGSLANPFVNVSQIDGLNFATETAIDPAAAMVSIRYTAGGFNSSTKGYIGGGNTLETQIDGIDFATETTIDPAAALVQGRTNHGAFQSNGYL